MIEYTTGDFVAADTKGVVNTLHRVGSLRRGVARQFPRARAEDFQEYATACRRDEVEPGSVFVRETRRLAPVFHTLSFPRNWHRRGRSRPAESAAARGRSRP